MTVLAQFVPSIYKINHVRLINTSVMLLVGQATSFESEKKSLHPRRIMKCRIFIIFQNVTGETPNATRHEQLLRWKHNIIGCGCAIDCRPVHSKFDGHCTKWTNGTHTPCTGPDYGQRESCGERKYIGSKTSHRRRSCSLCRTGGGKDFSEST